MMRKSTKISDTHIERGTSNVFADLGFADAESRQTKVRLALALNTIIKNRRIKQVEAAKLLGVSQPKVSALTNYKLEGFSVERLMGFLTALDQDVEIVIKDPLALSFSRTWSRPDGVDDDALIAATLDRPTFGDLAKLCLKFGEERVLVVFYKLSGDPAARPEPLADSWRMLENIHRGFRRASRQTT